MVKKDYIFKGKRTLNKNKGKKNTKRASKKKDDVNTTEDMMSILNSETRNENNVTSIFKNTNMQYMNAPNMPPQHFDMNMSAQQFGMNMPTQQLDINMANQMNFEGVPNLQI
jgi:uncharacterized membrane protein